MEKALYSRPLPLRAIQVTDPFWKGEMELVRREVIPYQWAALNDQVEGAAPSFCMHNFKTAGKLNREKRERGASFEEPKYTFRGFETLPEDPKHLDDAFYGFVFQDSDFSKWIEAVGYSLTQHPDPELERIADGAIDIVCAAQQDDGYLDTYYIINGKDRIFSNLKDHHELYCFGHLAEGAVAYFEATGKDKLLKAAERFADYIVALVRLYEATGNASYLALSRYFVDERGKRPYYFDREHPEEVKKGCEDGLRYSYYQAHLPVRQQAEAVGHAVRAVYLYSGMADVARLTGDGTLYEACKRLWDSITREKMYITGGIGATHIGEAFSFPYDLPNDTAYAETCASIGLVFFARRMLEIMPDARYANVMERALYNGILSGMALDGKSFFYVNPLEVLPEACHKDERKFHVKPVRQKWFGCACCPPNLARLISSIGSYAYTENDDTLFVHLYLGGTLEKKIGEKTADICIESGMPWNGDVTVRLRAKETGLKLALRLPDWCSRYGLEGAEGAALEEKDGYLYVEKDWAEEETLTLHFPMEIRLMAADENVREDAGKAALMRGPLVYCLEGADNGADLHLLSVNPALHAAEKEIEICSVPMKAIEADGFRIKKRKADGKETEGVLYRSYRKPEKNPVRLRFIPYYAWANRGENEMQVWTAVEG